MTNAFPNQFVELAQVAGPPIDLPRLPAGAEIRIGRGQGCDVFLPDPTVSRLHAAIGCRQGRWFLTDRGARHGTYLNELRLQSGEPTPVATGDLLRIGPWILRVQLPGARAGTNDVAARATLADAPGDERSVRIEAVTGSAKIAEHQLQLLLDCAAAMTGADNDVAIAARVIHAAREGTGFSRAALLRTGGSEHAEVIAGLPDDPQSRTMPFSRSLVAAATEGKTVQLSRDEPIADFGQSIAKLGITSAMCIPVRVADVTIALLYLDDAVGGTGAAHQSTAASARFCEALARLCGLGLANLSRHDLEARSRRIESELAAARGTQQLLMPERQPVTDQPISWALRSKPGRFVAGDLFDLVSLPGGRIAIVIGDVTGEGVQAGVLMAAAQSYLHALLRADGELVACVEALNRYVCERSSADRFVTLWVGILTHGTSAVHSVDAGHGHWAVRRTDGRVERLQQRGGIPIGIEPSFTYQSETFDLMPGERLILYTDGIVEQLGADGEDFGFPRLADALSSCRGPDEDADAVFDALGRFAAGRAWTDDATFASIAIVPDP